MGARAETLAKKYEAKAAELTATIQKLSDADWKKVTAAEKWPVGVTAHHVAGGHEPISGIVKTIASGQSIPNFTPGMLDEMNAKHAKEFAGCTKAETLALHEKGVKAAVAVVRSLGDADLDKSGTVLARPAGHDRPAGHRGHPDQPHRRSHGQHPQDRRRLTRAAGPRDRGRRRRPHPPRAVRAGARGLRRAPQHHQGPRPLPADPKAAKQLGASIEKSGGSPPPCCRWSTSASR